VPQADRAPGAYQPVVDVDRVLGRDVQLVAEFAEVTEASSSRDRGPWMLICA